MAAQWDEQQKLEDILGRRRMVGSPVQLEVVQNVHELFVHDPRNRGERNQRKKEVSVWSMEEKKEKLSIAVEEDTEEVKSGEV